MVWVTPRLTPESVAAIYSIGHAAKARSLGGPRRPVPRRYHHILKRLATLTGGPGRLLEVGAFDGLFLQAGREAGWQVAGTEIDTEAAAVAAGRGIAMHVGRLEDAPYAPDTFDAVALRDVIEHLPEPRADLARMATWLRPGGALYIWTPNVDSLTRRLYGQNWGAVVFPWHFTYFSAVSLRRMLEINGFGVVSLASRNLLLRRADPFVAVSTGQALPRVNPLLRRAERALTWAVNPLFARLDRLGLHWGAQLEVFATAESGKT
jgi:SAM-dependent methyltransferase